MSLDSPPAQPNVGPAPAPAPMYAQSQAKGKQKPKSQQPSALASGSVPEVTALGNKTLLGQ